MPSSRPLARLSDIRDNIDRILRYTEGMDGEAFARDRLRQDAVERCLERIAEASAKLGPQIREMFPEYPWDDVRGMGNRLRHEYDVVDPEIIWRVVTGDLRPLRERIEAAIENWSA